MMRALVFLASCCAAVAFVPPAQQTSVKYQAPAARAEEKTSETSGPFSSVAFGASVGYAAAAVGAAARQGRVTRFAEGDAPAVARTAFGVVGVDSGARKFKGQVEVRVQMFLW